VTSAARQEANRANALASTGPRTSAGKAISARNARRHGLNLRDPALADEIAALGREIAGPGAPARRFELACRIAAAQLDLLRVRRARHELYLRQSYRDRASRRLRSLRAPCAVTAQIRHSRVRRCGGTVPERSILAKRTQCPT
jgi:hypothetical protein